MRAFAVAVSVLLLGQCFVTAASAEEPAPPAEPAPAVVERTAAAAPAPEAAESTARTPATEDPPAADPPVAPSPEPSPPVPPAPPAEPAEDSSPEPSLPTSAEPEPSVALPLAEVSLGESGIGPMSIGLADVCAIGEDGYETLNAALAAATTGQTITVLKSFTHTSPVVIDGKNLTFDLSEGSITIDTTGSPGSRALTVEDSILTLTGGGFLDVTGYLGGVHADNATVPVRYATALWGTGAYAVGGGAITVQGDAKGYAIGAFAYGAGSTVSVGDDAIATGAAGRGAEAANNGQVTAKNAFASVINGIGASAYAGGTVTITQRAEGVAYGANAFGGGRITVGGDVTATGGSGIGAWASGGGRITVDGEVFGESEYYVRVGDVYKGQDDWETVTTLAGYRTYLDGTSTVWVKGAPLAVNVCEIDGTGFPTLDDALKEVDGTETAPTVIRLLRNIDYDRTLDLGGLHVVFDLNGHNLMVDGGDQTGLAVTSGSVGYTGSGAFVVTGGESVVEVSAGGSATVTGIRIGDDHTIGAHAGGDNSRITINGDIRTTTVLTRPIGAYASGAGAEVAVNGAIWIEGDNSSGASAYGGGRVAVQAGSGTVITVNGDYAVGAHPSYGGEVIVSGDVAVSGDDSTGVFAPGGIARIEGDVTASGAWSIGVGSSDEGEVTINGQVTVAGARSIGISAHLGEGSGGLVHVTGTVSVTGADALGVEAYSRETATPKSQVTIDGQLSAPQYLLVDNVPRTIDSNDSADALGYWLYLGPHGSLVKIRNGEPTATPTPTPTSTPTSTPTPTPTPDPTMTADPTLDPLPDDETPDPDPSSSSAPASSETEGDLDGLAMTGGPGEAQLLWLLGIMAAAGVSGLLILVLADRRLRR